MKSFTIWIYEHLLIPYSTTELIDMIDVQTSFHPKIIEAEFETIVNENKIRQSYNIKSLMNEYLEWEYRKTGSKVIWLEDEGFCSALTEILENKIDISKGGILIVKFENNEIKHTFTKNMIFDYVFFIEKFNIF